MSSGGDKDYDPSDCAIIREIYDNENAHEAFGEELERALEAGCHTIIIEPSRLGDETARWISVGNCLHKTAVLAGLGSIAVGWAWPDRPALFVPLTCTSLFCTGLYTVSWQFDPCCQYQVSKDANSLASHALTSCSPVVLVRKDDYRRKLLHSVVTLTSTLITAWKFYQTCIKWQV